MVFLENKIIFVLVIFKTLKPYSGQCLRQEHIHHQIVGILTHHDRKSPDEFTNIRYSLFLEISENIEGLEMLRIVVRPPDAPPTLQPGE